MGKVNTALKPNRAQGKQTYGEERASCYGTKDEGTRSPAGDYPFRGKRRPATFVRSSASVGGRGSTSSKYPQVLPFTAKGSRPID